MTGDATGELFGAIDTGDLETVENIIGRDRRLAAARGADGVSAVLHALYRGRRPIADALAAAVEAGAGVTSRGLDVFEAAALGRGAALERLLATDSSLATAWSADGFTALHLAAFFGGGGSAPVLIRAGADPNLRSRNDFAVMPIHSAVAGAHAAVVAALLEAGADPNVRQVHDFTPLHAAAQNGDAASVDLLLSAGADAGATSDDGRTPADLAEEGGRHGLAARLRAAAAPAAADRQVEGRSARGT